MLRFHGKCRRLHDSDTDERISAIMLYVLGSILLDDVEDETVETFSTVASTQSKMYS